MTTRIARHLFGNENALTISTRTIDNQHWYTAKSICILLNIKSHCQAVHRERVRDGFTLSESEWRKHTLFNGSKNKKMLLVNDNGMLKLILQGTSARAQEVQERARQTPTNLIPATWMPRTVDG
jgi:prophage antirepressor-like protein